jgi:hypothetical protein
MMVRTVENEEAILNAVEEDGTRSIQKLRAHWVFLVVLIRYTEF